jgi:hypothetical protein
MLAGAMLRAFYRSKRAASTAIFVTILARPTVREFRHENRS